MGCFDIFCIFCGNTCHVYDDPIFFEDLNLPKQELALLASQMAWLGKCVLLLANDEIVPDCREVACIADFQTPAGQMYSAAVDNLFYIGTPPVGPANLAGPGPRPLGPKATNKILNVGAFAHQDCYQYTCQKFKTQIVYSHLPIVPNEYGNSRGPFNDSIWSHYKILVANDGSRRHGP